MKIRLRNFRSCGTFACGPGRNAKYPAFTRKHCRLLAGILLIGLEFCAGQTADLNRARARFQHPPAECRIMMRWWWFGPAVSRPEIERELHVMKDAGIGGVELQPVYPLELDDPEHGIRNIPYASREFLDDVGFAASQARQLGLRFDLTLGSGWPFGGPHIPVTQAAGKLRIVFSSLPPGQSTIPVPGLEQGEALIAAFLSGGGPMPRPAPLDLNSIRDGRITLPEPSNFERGVTWYISSRTGMMVKRAAFGAEGFVLDHFDPAAIRTHLHEIGDPLLSSLGTSPPYAVFSDSLEVYGSDWTSSLIQEFQKRRGYDLIPLLPALTNSEDPQSPDVRHDWAKTLTELIDEGYLTPIREWARLHKTRFRSQTYGIPAVTLSSNHLVDLPEGEGDNWRAFSPSRWASSASHLYKVPVTSAETWTWLHSPAFRATPLDMKADADRFFLQGINQLIGHGWPYSPAGIPAPGWSFYAAGAFDDQNPWWPVMPQLTAYLERISYILRQGQPANDVAVLVPTDDLWSELAPGTDSVSELFAATLPKGTIPQILDSGFNFDFIDAEAIDKVGIPYGALVLPNVDRLELVTYQKIQQYAEGGGIVIATGQLPARAAGVIERQRDSEKVQAVSKNLFQKPGAPGLFVLSEGDLGKVLAQRLTPDILRSPGTSELGFVHRRLPAADVYFLANTGNRRISFMATFRTNKRSAEWWDPFSGDMGPAGRGAQIQLQLEPYESRVLVFSDQPPEKPPLPFAAGKPSVATTAGDLQNDWSLSFPKLHKTVHPEQLSSWTEPAETRFYSGPGVYEKDFSFAPKPDQQVFLDFGPGVPIDSTDKHGRFFAGIESPVREVAEVYLNGAPAGWIWKPPYRLKVTGLLRDGGNHLRVLVYNTAMNQLAGRPQPDFSLLNSRYGTRFSPQDSEDIKPLPSGMLAAPHLVFEESGK